MMFFKFLGVKLGYKIGVKNNFVQLDCYNKKLDKRIFFFVCNNKFIFGKLCVFK